MSNISFLLFPVNLQHGRDPAADSKKRIKADSTAEHHHREDMSPPSMGLYNEIKLPSEAPTEPGSGTAVTARLRIACMARNRPGTASMPRALHEK